MINKKILFIAPQYFGYEYDIISELEKKGARIFFVQENIGATKFRYKILNKFPSRIRDYIIRGHFIRIFKKLYKEGITFDYIFCIRIDSFDHIILSKLKQLYPDAKYVCYFWDSIKNMRNPKAVASFFDRVFTFDKIDAEGEGWNFCPLFFNKKYECCLSGANKEIDILFVASLLPERAKLFTTIKTICENNNLNLFTYFTVNPYLYYVNKKTYKNIPSSIIFFKGLQQSELVKLFSKSKVIIDCSSSSQSGLTMRTIECIGAKKKIITTNENIKEYDFYNESNVLYINDNPNESVIVDFISNDVYEELNCEVYKYYSIDNWTTRIFEDE